MRTSPNRTIALPPMPFDGLGLPMASVRAASREMQSLFHRHDAGTKAVFLPPARDAAVHTGGYRLLVAQGREIRGR